MNQTVKPRAAIYTRISKDKEGREFGVKRQERLCREKAQELGVEVITVFSDNDISASRRSRKPRPRYEEMLKQSRLGEFSMVIAYSTSRLTRRPRQFEDWIDLYDSRGVIVQTVNTKGANYDLSTAQGRGDARRRAASDAEESDEISERVAEAAKDRALRGEWHGGAVPFGYRREIEEVVETDEDTDEATTRLKTVLVPEPEDVALIHEAIKRLLEGRETLYAIIKDWNSRGIHTRPTKKSPEGNAWRHATLRATLTNRTLLGETKAGVAGWEPVLDEDTFNLLRARLVDPSRRASNPLGAKSSKYAMGGGLTICGVCKRPLVGVGRHREDGSDYVKLACKAIGGRPDPEHPRESRIVSVKGVKTTVQRDAGRVVVRHDLLETYVWDLLIAKLKVTPRWQARGSETDPQIIAKQNKLQVERTRLLARRDVAKEMRLEGELLKDEYTVEIEAIKTELQRIDQRERDLTGAPIIDAAFNSLDEIVASWRGWAPGKRRAFLSAFIDQVKVNPWPENRSTTTLKKRDETQEQYIARREANWTDGMAERVEPVWNKRLPWAADVPAVEVASS